MKNVWILLVVLCEHGPFVNVFNCYVIIQNKTWNQWIPHNVFRIPDSSECFCFPTGGDMPYQSQFSLDKHTGDLWLRESLDREEIANVDLIIQADNDCWSDYWYREENIHQTWNYSDTTTLLVEVKVVDINDNPPRFTKDWFTAGVTKQTQYGQRVIDLSVSGRVFPPLHSSDVIFRELTNTSN